MNRVSKNSSLELGMPLFSRMQKTQCLFTHRIPKLIIAILVLVTSFNLCGCDLQATEDAGGIASPATSTPENRVNPSQDADSSFLYDTSIDDLSGASASILDEQTVQVQGEVIGDARKVDFDSEHFWITLQAEENNKFSTITVFCTKNTTDLIDTFGSYGRRGTTLQIRGTFHISCSEHDGLSDIHAESSSIKAYGNVVNPPLKLESLAFGFTMLIFGGIMIFIYVYAAKLKKKKVAEEDLANEEEIEEEL